LKSEIDWTAREQRAAAFAAQIAAHPAVCAHRRSGAMFAFDLASADEVEKVVHYCLEKGLLTFWFLSHPYSFRLSPPLNLSQEDWYLAAKVIISALDRL
jgi:4-aminobutyrate aminotransferase-like enzyme